MPGDLYRSDTLRVVATPCDDTSRWAITFDHLYSARGLDREGFAHRFFLSRGISQIAILATDCRWYHYPDTAAAIDAAAAYVAGARRIMTYGSSMGGYAALRFASRLGANACVALSPQFTIDPRRAPFEQRWLAEAQEIDWQHWIEAPIRLGFSPLVVADGRGDDARHVAMIAAETAIDAVSLDYTAHPVTTFLSSAGLLAETVLGTLDGSLDPGGFRQKAARARRTDPTYLGEIARLQPASRPRLGVDLARRATAAAPDNPLAQHVLATRLATAGRLDEALVHHDRAVTLSDGFFGYRLGQAETLATRGDTEAAIAIAREIAAEQPGNASLRSWAAGVCWKGGDRAAAIDYAAEACALMPGIAFFREQLKQYRKADGVGRRIVAALARPAAPAMAAVLGLARRRRASP